MTSLLNSFKSGLPSLSSAPSAAQTQLENDINALSKVNLANAENRAQRAALSGGGSVKNTTVNYSLAPTGTLLNEGYSKVQGDMSEAGSNFRGLAVGQPSFLSMGSIKGALGKLKSNLTSAFSSKSPSIPGLAASSANLTEPSATAASINAATSAESESNTDHKVTLTASVSDGESEVLITDPVNFPHEPLLQRRVEFDAMPEVSEVRTAEYEPLSAPQMPGEFQKYKGTKSTQWTVIGTFVCRTRAEAARNYHNLNTLRSWLSPYFGTKQGLQFSGKLGAPPPVVTFAGWRGLVGAVPTVLTSLNWTWPKDVDWIPTGIKDGVGAEIPFPTVMIVTINLVESFSPTQFNNFDLVEFRRGRMVGAFSNETTVIDEEVHRAEAVGGQQVIANGTATAEPSDVVPRAIILDRKPSPETILSTDYTAVQVGGPIPQATIIGKDLPAAQVLAASPTRAEATTIVAPPATQGTPKQQSMVQINQGISAAQAQLEHDLVLLNSVNLTNAANREARQARVDANTALIAKLQAEKKSDYWSAR